MQKKNNYKKTLAAAMSCSLIASNAIPAFADSQTITENGNAEIEVVYNQASSFSVTIPKAISLDSNKESSYSVKVEGDIAANQIVSVVPADSATDVDGTNFYMKDQSTTNPKADVLANMTQTKTEWNFQEVADSYEETNNNISAPNLTSGEWKGNFDFLINLKNVQGEGLTLSTENDVLMGSDTSMQVNAYLDGKESNSKVTWTSSNENITVEDGLLTVNKNVNPGDTATITVTYTDTSENDSSLIAALENTGIITKANADDSQTATLTVTVIDIVYNTEEEKNINYLDVSTGTTQNIEAEVLSADATVNWKTEQPKGIFIVKDGNSLTFDISDNAKTGSYELEAELGTCKRTLKVNVFDDTTQSSIAGLYDDNNNLIASWNSLVNDYGLDVQKNYYDLTGHEDMSAYPHYQHDSHSLYYILNNNNNLQSGTKLIVGDNVTNIGSMAFADCNLKNIVINDNTVSIQKNAFSSKSIEQITLGAKFSTFSRDMLKNAENLKSIYVSANNKNYSSADGVIFNKNKTELVMCGPAKTAYIIPSSVTAINDDAFTNCKNLTSVEIPNSVTSIGESAFYYCSGLTEITIPDSVTSIERCAFSGCSNLTTVKLSNNLTSIKDGTFSHCYKLKNINISNNITTFENDAFNRCYDLNNINIPNTVTSIGRDTFYDILNVNYSGTATGSPWSAKAVNGYAEGYLLYRDSSKTELVACGDNASGEIVIPSTVTKIAKNAFSICNDVTSVIIPSSVKTIDMYAFSDNEGITEITIPDSVTSIGSYAFNNCKNLKKAVINGGTIERYAFGNCKNLETVVIGENVSSIGDSSFSCYNSKLSNITIKNGVTSIGSYAFASSIATNVSIPSSVTSIGTNAFRDILNITYSGTATGSPWGAKSMNGHVDGDLIFSDSAKTQLITCSPNAVGEIVIPDTVTAIANNAFSNCKNITGVTIPASVKTIGDYAFSSCSNLKEVHLTDGLTSIGTRAFSSCSSLTSITLPDTVTSLGTYAFASCSNLESAVLSSGLTTLPQYADTFSYCTNLKSVYLPKSITSIIVTSSTWSDGRTTIDTPFMNCSSHLKIYCGAASKPSGYQNYWNYYSATAGAQATWGVTKADYEANYR